MKCDGCGQEKDALHLVGQTNCKQELCNDCLGTKDSHISINTLSLAKKNEIELRELFGNITYDMIVEQVAQETKQEVYKEVRNEAIELSKNIATIERRWYDLMEWLEEKQKAFSATLRTMSSRCIGASSNDAFRRKG